MFVGREGHLEDLETLWSETVLVYDGELDGAVEGNGYFDAIVPARKLLGL